MYECGALHYVQLCTRGHKVQSYIHMVTAEQGRMSAGANVLGGRLSAGANVPGAFVRRGECPVGRMSVYPIIKRLKSLSFNNVRSPYSRLSVCRAILSWIGILFCRSV